MKKNYSGAEALILQVSRAYICEAFMTWAGMDTLHSVPTSHIVPKKSAAQEEKTAYIEKQIGAFVDKCCLLDAGVEQMWTLSESQRRSQREAANVTSSNETVAPSADLKRPGRCITCYLECLFISVAHVAVIEINSKISNNRWYQA